MVVMTNELNRFINDLHHFSAHQQYIKHSNYSQKFIQSCLFPFNVSVDQHINNVVELARKLGFIMVNDDLDVKITEYGINFYKKAIKGQYNITEKQKDFIIEIIITSKIFEKEYNKLKVSKFRLNSKSSVLNQVYNLLNETGYLKNEKVVYWQKSQLELDNKLKNDKQIGDVAEEIVEREEKKNFDYIMNMNPGFVTAGYDLVAGKDNKERYIEVKGTTGLVKRFFWSRNEIEKAREKGDDYWIYCVTNVDVKRKTGEIHRIKDPYNELGVENCLIRRKNILKVGEVEITNDKVRITIGN